MVEMNDMIIKYIDSVYEVKGGIIVHSFGTRVYFNEIHKHITDTFNLDEFVAIGYLISCFSDTELDYDMFVCEERPLTMLDLLNMDYVMGVDPAMDNEPPADPTRYYGYAMRRNARAGIQLGNDDMVDAIRFAILNNPAP